MHNAESSVAAPETAARGMVYAMPHPTEGTVRNAGSPLKFSGTPVQEPVAPPLLGQHTDAVLANMLGLDAARIVALRSAGAVA